RRRRTARGERRLGGERHAARCCRPCRQPRRATRRPARLPRAELIGPVERAGLCHPRAHAPADRRRVAGTDWLRPDVSGDPPADVTVFNPTFDRAYVECDTWRDAVFATIAADHPSLVVMAMSRTYTMVDGGSLPTVAQRPDLWNAAISRSLRRLEASADEVVLIGDTPRSKVDPPVCLSRHLDDVLACATPSSKSLAVARTVADRTGAAAAGADFIYPSPWICPSEPCPVVIGSYLVFRDNPHRTTAFSAALSRRLLDALPAGGPRFRGAARVAGG